jgi:hypothetical protein
VYKFPDLVLTINPGKLYKVETFSAVHTQSHRKLCAECRVEPFVWHVFVLQRGWALCSPEAAAGIVDTYLSGCFQRDKTDRQRQKCGLINKTISQISFLSSKKHHHPQILFSEETSYIYPHSPPSQTFTPSHGNIQHVRDFNSLGASKRNWKYLAFRHLITSRWGPHSADISISFSVQQTNSV